METKRDATAAATAEIIIGKARPARDRLNSRTQGENIIIRNEVKREMLLLLLLMMMVTVVVVSC